MIVANVDRTKVPIFINKKVQHVYGMEYVGNNDRISYVAMSLVLIRREGKVTVRST